jgi:hypothetical protein
VKECFPPGSIVQVFVPLPPEMSPWIVPRVMLSVSSPPPRSIALPLVSAIRSPALFSVSLSAPV